jgi:hypothetical protein
VRSIYEKRNTDEVIPMWQLVLKGPPDWLDKYKKWLNRNKAKIEPDHFFLMQTLLWNPSRLRIKKFKMIARIYEFFEDYGGPN